VPMRKLSLAVVRWNGVPTVAQRRGCGGGKGNRRRWGSSGNARARVRVRGGCPLYSGGATRACGPGAGGVAGDLGPLRPGKKKEREKKALTRGARGQ
jgi:hypothetical protein